MYSYPPPPPSIVYPSLPSAPAINYGYGNNYNNVGTNIVSNVRQYNQQPQQTYPIAPQVNVYNREYEYGTAPGRHVRNDEQRSYPPSSNVASRFNQHTVKRSRFG